MEEKLKTGEKKKSERNRSWTFLKKKTFIPMLDCCERVIANKIKICQFRICDDMLSAILF